MLALLGPILPYILGVLVAMCAGAAAYFKIRQSGKMSQQAADARAEQRDTKNALDVQSRVGSEPDSAVADDLRRHWTKPRV